MPCKCCVPACRGNYDASTKVMVFGFPTDEALRKKWLQAIPRKDFNVTKHSKVCEKHFNEGDVELVTTFYVEATGETLRAKLKKPKLKEGAIPAIFPDAPSNLRSTKNAGGTSHKGQNRCKYKEAKLPIKTAGIVIKQEKEDDTPLEPTIEIKKEPEDDYPNPSTLNDNADEGFITPQKENTWETLDSVVEPQFTLSVASLSYPDEPETSGGKRAKKKRRANPRKLKALASPPPSDTGAGPQSPVCDFGESSNPGSPKECRKDQFDAFGEYIAAKLRSLDLRSSAYAQKAIGDIIFEAELGKYRSRTTNTKS